MDESHLTEVAGSGRSQTKAKKSVACHPCHSRKRKCSGETPCRTCISAGREAGCTYTLRPRYIKVTESYVEGLQSKIQRLERAVSQLPPSIDAPLRSEETEPIVVRRSPSTEDTLERSDEAESIVAQSSSISNPLVQRRSEFVAQSAGDLPIFIADAASPIFATHVRRALDPSGTTIPHIPRTSFVHDITLLQASRLPTTWPSKAQAQIFTRMALVAVGRTNHVLLVARTLHQLEQAYTDPLFENTVVTSKILALFALGEVYSIRGSVQPGGSVPGLSYFMQASALLRLCPERASIDHVEVMLLFAFFSMTMNRRNSAFIWLGNALRTSLTLGFHRTMSLNITDDKVFNEHRIRLWWTIYICDRLWGTKMGLPLSIQDHDISIDLPSELESDNQEQPEIGNGQYINAKIGLARIAGNLVSPLYARADAPQFLSTIQVCLQSLRSWMKALPSDLNLPTGSRSLSREIVTLHLSFNECLILATRPLLLYLLQISLKDPEMYKTHTTATYSSTITNITTSCIQAARNSLELLIQSRVEGNLVLCGYFDAQYLFSSSIILIVSSLLHTSSKDVELLECAVDILKLMADSGNFSAAEFQDHLSQLQKSTNKCRPALVNIDRSEDFIITNDSDHIAGEFYDPLTSLDEVDDFPQINLDLNSLNPMASIDSLSHFFDVPAL